MPGDYEYSFYPVKYLREKYGDVTDPDEEAIFIAGNLLPRPDIIEAAQNIKKGQAFVKEKKERDDSEQGFWDNILMYRGTLHSLLDGKIKKLTFTLPYVTINYTYEIFLKNAEEIIRDFQIITKGRRSQPLPACVRKISSSNLKGLGRLIFIEKGAKVECSTINLTKGPVYIGKDAVLMEGACIRGPFALCEASEIRMGAMIYEGTTVGPHCKVGGEVSNTVFLGYSNKAHGGYLGNAVIGEWCNIGAGTNASNLKNDYTLIRLWNYHTHSFMHTDLQFCGLIMGDHSKIGVNCMINTATVIGVGVNIHGAGFPRAFVPCFSEGSPASGFSHVSLKKFLETTKRVMIRRDLSPSEAYESMLTHIYDHHDEI